MYNKTSVWHLSIHCLISFAIFSPLNAELNPICHLLALLGAHHILHVSRIRVKEELLLLSSFTDFTGRYLITFDIPLSGGVHVRFPSAFFLRDFFLWLMKLLYRKKLNIFVLPFIKL
jgi:hypothetical protein